MRGLLFKTDMIRAIREGHKTVTRRLKTYCKAGETVYVKETYFLKILSVRQERLQEITPEDVVLEGIPDIGAGDLRGMYAVLWDSINPKQPWASNPLISRIEFKVLPEPEKER